MYDYIVLLTNHGRDKLQKFIKQHNPNGWRKQYNQAILDILHCKNAVTYTINAEVLHFDYAIDYVRVLDNRLDID